MYDGTDTVPLFGDARPRDKYLNYVIGGFTSVLVMFTFMSSLIPWQPSLKNVLLALAIVLSYAGEITLIFWYRKGDLDPKFRKLIYYNCFALIFLCIAANSFYYPKK